MNDPTRWLDPDGGARPSERSVLAAADDASPPPGADERVWRSLLAAIGPGLPPAPGTSGPGAPDIGSAGALGGASGASTAGGGGAASALGLGVLLKSVAIGLVAGGMVVGGAHAVRLSEVSHPRPVLNATPAPQPPAPAADEDAATTYARAERPASTLSAHRGARDVRATTRQPAERSPEQITVDEPQRPTHNVAAFANEPSGGEPLSPPSSALDHSALSQEAALVRAARERVRAGDAPGALRLLEQANTRFGSGALLQEREALAIEALERAGQHAAALERASAFRRAYPRSPHGSRLPGGS